MLHNKLNTITSFFPYNDNRYESILRFENGRHLSFSLSIGDSPEHVLEKIKSFGISLEQEIESGKL